jgi:hypothetical protein
VIDNIDEFRDLVNDFIDLHLDHLREIGVEIK